MREFTPVGKVNQSAKKRLKRKAKKENEIKLKQEEEQRKKEKAVRDARAALSSKGKQSLIKSVQLSDDGNSVTIEGKVFKKKMLPKTKIHDDQGGLDWEVTEKKKKILVEEDEEDERSD